jgi:hypothetical protein
VGRRFCSLHSLARQAGSQSFANGGSAADCFGFCVLRDLVGPSKSWSLSLEADTSGG